MASFKLKTGETVLIDDTDLERISLLRWHRGSEGYVKHSFRHDGKVNSLYLHTFLTGLPKVDHRNGNRLDNQRSNLRPASNSQNSANKRKSPGQSSRFKGVSWHKLAGKWQAALGPRSHIYLGLFESEVEAAKAYNTEALKRYGEFAKLNPV